MRFAVIFFAATVAMLAQPKDPRIRIFVGESEAWQASSFSALGANSSLATAFGASQSGAVKLTVVMMKEISERCPNVVIVSKPDSADLFVRVDRNTGRFGWHEDMAVFNKSGEMVFAASSGKVSKDAKRFCESSVFGVSPKMKHKKESW
jgi:hypothetical protein